MTKTTEVFHIFTSSYPNLLIKWRSTSSFPIVFFNYEKTREFLRRSENSFRPFYSVNHSIWKSPKMSHFLAQKFKWNICGDFQRLFHIRNNKKNERKGCFCLIRYCLLYILFLTQKHLCIMLQQKKNHVKNVELLKVILHFILCFWPITKFEVCSAISQRLLNKQNHLQVHSMHFHNVWKSLKKCLIWFFTFFKFSLR